ncbi:hypothetical protein QQP08_022342 [Theobroma cacao]|uniref:Uncharacterized protein isoform 1 n=1 Tax=Theobroma cacao TaxID=3641 RepID=A0A061FGU3_THECC|nr:Uncharacterized protein TCM_035105 isoform 1 [Theobroma cacao]EOY16272.1 Uncharacterized protein TCM_035105 isoform 1 [Theobroma cacao]WRX29855.1 hypothetical protein QQP08_022342 [Theobroma cacao]
MNLFTPARIWRCFHPSSGQTRQHNYYDHRSGTKLNTTDPTLGGKARNSTLCPLNFDWLHRILAPSEVS